MDEVLNAVTALRTASAAWTAASPRARAEASKMAALQLQYRDGDLRSRMLGGIITAWSQGARDISILVVAAIEAVELEIESMEMMQDFSKIASTVAKDAFVALAGALAALASGGAPEHVAG